MGKWIDYTQVSSVADDDTIMINGKNLATKQALLSELNQKITELESGSSSGSGVTSTMASTLWAIIQKCAFATALTDAEKNAFKTAWGITDSSSGGSSSDSGSDSGGTSSGGSDSGSTDSGGSSSDSGSDSGGTSSGGSDSGSTDSGGSSSGGSTDTPTVEAWEEALTLSYATSASPSSSNDWTGTTTTNTGYANALSNLSEHTGGVLHVDFTDDTIGFEVAIILEKEDGTRIPAGIKDGKQVLSAGNTDIEAIEHTTTMYITNRNYAGVNYTVKIPDGCKIQLYFRIMSNKANVIAQNGVTFTLKSA